MRAVQWLTVVGGLLFIPGFLLAEAVELSDATLPGTKPLTLQQPLHEVMVAGISAFAERELHRIQDERDAAWVHLDGDAQQQARAATRNELRHLIGLNEAIPARPVLYRRERARSESHHVSALRWDTGIPGVSGYGLACTANATNKATAPVCLLIGDADQSPEELIGWLPTTRAADASAVDIVRQMSTAGCDVYLPRLVNRQLDEQRAVDASPLRRTNLPRRELVYRCGFELGRHILGYETARILSLAAAIKAEQPERPVLLIGVGEGGLLSLLTAALDTDEHIAAVIVRGYFGTHRNVWQEPLERNIWRGQIRFGNAELAALSHPRPLWVDPRSAPELDGVLEPPAGGRQIAAPRRLVTPTLEDAQAEVQRAADYDAALGAPVRVRLLASAGEAELQHTLREIRPSLADPPEKSVTWPRVRVPDDVSPETIVAEQTELTEELIRHTQAVLHRSNSVRSARWSSGDLSSVAAWQDSAAHIRDEMLEELIGQLPGPLTNDVNVRTRKVIDAPTHVGFEVLLDVYGSSDAQGASPEPGSMIAGGILLLPRGINTTERRPVVVCQHGLEGTPEDTITEDRESRAWRAYKGFSTQLVKQGYVVYAPQNPYKGYDAFREIQRKSNPVGRSLFSYIIEQHRQTLHWLAMLPYVDPDRIAFYGLSYGGKTAVRVPPLLVDHADQGKQKPLYCLSICSADFNEWIRKNSSAEARYTYVFTPEYEIWEWNMGHIAGYAELSSLMAPRPFMVERGHGDGVAPDEWVGWEFAKVRRHYDALGIGDQTEIEWFNGPHTINGQGTFRFLAKHLNWPTK
ncbi:MAG: hypothetical protein KDA58_03465 [Planctomycetaceae bacterium]|nr:hypothetical protein [Planctomycetaceae bacterium]